MGDAFKCKNCGTVVETLQSCPSCGETAMQPIQSSGDTGVVADVVESETADGTDDESSGAETAATDAGATSNGDTNGTAPADSTGTETASDGRQERTSRETDSNSGLLSWLKSLF